MLDADQRRRLLGELIDKPLCNGTPAPKRYGAGWGTPPPEPRASSHRRRAREPRGRRFRGGVVDADVAVEEGRPRVRPMPFASRLWFIRRVLQGGIDFGEIPLWAG